MRVSCSLPSLLSPPREYDENTLLCEMHIEQQVFPHWSLTYITDSWHQSMHQQHLSRNHMCSPAFSQHCGASHRRTVRHKANGHPRPRQQEDCGGAWCAAVDNAALVAEAALAWRRGVAQHRATTWLGDWFVDAHLSNCALFRSHARCAAIDEIQRWLVKAEQWPAKHVICG